ncbi:uncharacterized protein LOC121371276 isoform X2 [Gigantopelta aegis]|uniref:uncharacterized protein LOC121371276 isoform X2 n=1 Tax=Gigantopelta aegis TaxID=1735272 RepID=UPI001B888561|nr:uncharacterized protein LOC121371276 isoform X2 [Gigantopelta aegis]
MHFKYNSSLPYHTTVSIIAMPRPKANKKVLGKALAAAKNIHYGRTTPTKARKKNVKTSQLVEDSTSNEKDVGNRILNSPTKRLFNGLKRELMPLANQKNAVAMKGYMRGQFEFLGIQAPGRRAAAKQFISECKKLDSVQIKMLVDLMWEQPEREFQQTALDLCAKSLPVLCGKTDEDCLESLMWTKTIITTKSWWDTVDLLASKVVGGLVSHSPTKLNPVMDAWIQDENMWLRRTAILHQLGYKNKTDQDRLFRYCSTCADEKEFFIRKAIGWALRNYHYINKDAVRTFVAKNRSKLSDLSIKEALKHD